MGPLSFFRPFRPYHLSISPSLSTSLKLPDNLEWIDGDAKLEALKEGGIVRKLAFSWFQGPLGTFPFS